MSETTETTTETTPEAKPRPKGVSNTAANLAAHFAKAREEVAPPKPEEKKPEAKEAPKEEAKPKPQPVAPQLAAVMERERRVQEAEARVKAAQAEAQAFSKAKSAGDIEGALKLLGLTAAQVADYRANGNKPTAELETKALEDRVRAEIEPLKATLREQRESLQRSAMANAEATYKADLLKTAKSAGEKFEFCASEKFAAEAMDTAVDVLKGMIAQRRAEAGGRALNADEVPTPEEVLSKVEEYYESQFSPERLLTIGKLKAKLSPVASQSAAPPAASKPGPTRAAPRTLTNAAVAAAPPGSPSKRPTTAERKVRLEALFRGGGSTGG